MFAVWANLKYLHLLLLLLINVPIAAAIAIGDNEILRYKVNWKFLILWYGLKILKCSNCLIIVTYRVIYLICMYLCKSTNTHAV